MDYLLTLAITLILAAIDAAIKNTGKRAAMRRVFTKVRDGLLVAYPVETYPVGSSRISDSDFEQVKQREAEARAAGITSIKANPPGAGMPFSPVGDLPAEPEPEKPLSPEEVNRRQAERQQQVAVSQADGAGS